MRIFIAYFLFSLVKGNICEGNECSFFSEESKEIEYLPHVSTSIDLRGKIRKLLGVATALKNHDRNILISPVLFLLSMSKLLIGAKKHSAIEKELMNAVGLNNRREIPTTVERVKKNLNKTGSLTIASKTILSKKNRVLNKNYELMAEKIFGSSIDLINMQIISDVVEMINTWVGKDTGWMMRSIVTASDILKDGSLTFLDALIFKGYWKYPFLTKKMQKFYCLNGEKYDVAIMTANGPYNYIKSDDLSAQILEIPFVGNESSMIILLPNTRRGLPILLRTLESAPHVLNEALGKMRTVEVCIALPHIYANINMDLKPYLQTVGIKTFKNPALGNIISDENVYISKLIQKIILQPTADDSLQPLALRASTTEDSEKLLNTSARMDFIADHPFLFYIKVNLEQILVGTYNRPFY